MFSFNRFFPRLLICFFLGMTGCITTTYIETQEPITTQDLFTPSATVTSKEEFSGTIIPSNTPKPVNTLQSESTATITLSATATLVANTQMAINCVRESSLYFNLNGATVLMGEPVTYGKWRLFDLTNNHAVEIVGDEGIVTTVSISPDNMHMSFIDIKQGLLQIVDGKGKSLQSTPVSKNWHSVIHWVNLEHLLIENIPLFSDDTLNPPASSVLYDISEEEVEAEYPHGYPGQVYIGNGTPAWGPYYFTQSVFDPDFTRVIYPALPAMEDIGAELTLWDLINQREIAQFWVGDPHYGGLPQWSRDGSYFIAGIYPQYVRWDGEIFANFNDGLPYIGGYDLFRVSRNGELERLTYFSTQHQSYMQGYSLSPDERQIVFWLVLDEEDIIGPGVKRKLAILDTETDNITDLCIEGGDVPYPPVWSPDGQYLIITISDSEKSMSDVFLIDLEEGYSIRIAEQAVGLGWLIPSP